MQRARIEKEIQKLDDKVLINYELEKLAEPQANGDNYAGVLDAVNCAVCGTKLEEHEKEGGNCCDECWLRN